MKCEICKKTYRHLGSHLWHAHKIKSRDYKKEFGLDLNTPLINEDIIEKKKNSFWKNPVGLKNLTTEHCFKKGVANRDYYSRASKERIKNQYQKYLEKDHTGTCKICGHTTKHMYSHMFNKHGVLVVNKDKFNRI